ncbi:MAG: pentapeptide repeat-containing protein [Deltaproteobacteria bacterium]|nr:pentapeptide repeat-containing protein [Deltaproteobacteria bacterium]
MAAGAFDHDGRGVGEHQRGGRGARGGDGGRGQREAPDRAGRESRGIAIGLHVERAAGGEHHPEGALEGRSAIQRPHRAVRHHLGEPSIVEVGDQHQAVRTHDDVHWVEEARVASGAVRITLLGVAGQCAHARTERTDVDRRRVGGGGIELARVELTRVELTRVDLARVDLAGVDLTRIGLAGVDLTRVDLTRVDLARVDLARVLRAQVRWPGLGVLESRVGRPGLGRCVSRPSVPRRIGVGSHVVLFGALRQIGAHRRARRPERGPREGDGGTVPERRRAQRFWGQRPTCRDALQLTRGAEGPATIRARLSPRVSGIPACPAA